MLPLSATTKNNLLLTNLRQKLQTIYGSRLKNLILFGSWARGDASDESDIDVLVVLGGPVNTEHEIERTGNIISDLSLTYNVVISCVFISKKRFINEQSPFVLNVHQEGIPV